MSSELEVNTNGIYTSNSDSRLRNITIRDNVTDIVTPMITKMTVTWAPSTETLQRVRFGTSSYWGLGNVVSGTQIDIMDYDVQSSYQNMDMYFSGNIRGKTFTIQFLFSDTSTKTVTLYVP